MGTIGEQGVAPSEQASLTPYARLMSGESLTAVMSVIPDAAVVVGRSGVIVSANQLAETLFGFEAGKLTGMTIETLIPERFRSRHRQHRSGFQASPQVRPMGVGLELSGRHSDGHEFPVDISLAPVSNAGDPLVVATIRDVSEQRRATAAEAELATIVRFSLDAIISTSVEGKLLSWNPAAEGLFGYGAREILGRHLSILVPDGESAVLEELLDAAHRGERTGARDTRWRHLDGHEIDVAISISPLNETNATLRGFSLLIRDITERKAAERELRRLLDEEERLQRQHAATSEIRLALLSGGSLQDTLMLICRLSSELVAAPAVSICERVGGKVRVAAGAGPAVDLVDTLLPIGGSFAELVMERAERVEVDRRHEVSQIEGSSPFPDGPTLGIPVLIEGEVSAALTLVRQLGAAGFEPSALALAEGLAAQAALAYELDRGRHQKEELMLVSDRERIARDLHDHVIQQLFATGIGLQGSLGLVEDPVAQRRISAAIDALDDTIRDIRNAIFGLSHLRQPDEPQLSSRVEQLINEARAVLGFEPSVVFEGPVDLQVSGGVQPHVLACVREGLANVARHSQATAVTVSLVIRDGSLVVEIADNGVGMGSPSRSSGLANLRQRAEMFGGTLDLSAPVGGGTRLRWKVPTSSSGQVWRDPRNPGRE